MLELRLGEIESRLANVHNFYYVLSTTWRVQYTSPFD